MTISANQFVVVIVLGGAVLALWTVARFPALGPTTPWGALAHFALASVLGSMFLDRAPEVLLHLPLPRAPLIAVIVGALTPMVYLLMSLAWFIRSIQRLVG